MTITNNNQGTISEGTGTIGTRIIDVDYPAVRGLQAGTTIHLIDNIDYDDESN